MPNDSNKGKPQPDISGIKKLTEKLYGRAIPKETEERRHKLHEEYKNVATGWMVPTEKLSRLRVGASQKQPSLLIGLFLFSMVFFVLAFGLAAYFFFTGGNVVSNNRIDLKITAPVASPAGEEFAMSVEIVNRNSASLLLTDFLVEWPDGTRSPTDRKTEQPRTLEELGDIAPGKSLKTNARGVLFGEENEVKDVNLIVQYRVEGSNAVFSKEVTYSVTLSSAPIVLRVSAPPEMVSGQEIEFVADVISNATAPLKNVMVAVDYPFGFEPTGADPETSIGDNFWVLGDFKPGEQQQIRIRGKLVAQNSEDRAFRFRIGSQSAGSEREFSTLFGEITKTIVVKRPFIATTLTLHSSEQNPKTEPRGGQIPGSIKITNTLPGKILDIEIEVALSGSAFDRKTVKGSSGSYRSTDHTVFWNKNTKPLLAELEPGKSENVDFDFASIPLAQDTGLENPNIHLDVVVRATRLREADEAPEVISTTLSRDIRINSDVFMIAQSLHTIGPFTNFGPFPPRADQETSYTITWTAQNSSNDLANTRIFGTLPVNVRFTGLISPGGERVTFDADKRRVTWDIGNLPHGTGFADPVRTVSFQVAVTPSVTEINNILPLVQNQSIVGTDRYTGVELSNTDRDLTTEIRNDTGVSDRKFYQVQP